MLENSLWTRQTIRVFKYISLYCLYVSVRCVLQDQKAWTNTWSVWIERYVIQWNNDTNCWKIKIGNLIKVKKVRWLELCFIRNILYFYYNIPGVCTSFSVFLLEHVIFKGNKFEFIQNIGHWRLHISPIFHIIYEYRARKTACLLRQIIIQLQLPWNCWSTALPTHAPLMPKGNGWHQVWRVWRMWKDAHRSHFKVSLVPVVFRLTRASN